MERRLSWQIPPKPILLVKASVLNCKKLHGLILPKNQLLRPLIASVEPDLITQSPIWKHLLEFYAGGKKPSVSKEPTEDLILEV